MTEVEKKISLTEDNINKLIKGAQFIGRYKFTDIYYDTADYVLTRNNTWLRQRNNKWELKIPIIKHNKKTSYITYYKEIINKNQIKKQLDLNLKSDLKKELRRCGYKPFAKFTTIRKRYRKDSFKIDIDITDFGYKIVEIELLENKDAYDKIQKFIKKNNIKIKPARSKIGEFIRRNNRFLYLFLSKNKII